MIEAWLGGTDARGVNAVYAKIYLLRHHSTSSAAAEAVTEVVAPAFPYNDFRNIASYKILRKRSVTCAVITSKRRRRRRPSIEALISPRGKAQREVAGRKMDQYRYLLRHFASISDA